MKFIKKTAENKFVIEMASSEVVEKEYSRERVVKKLAKLNDQIEAIKGLKAKRTKFEEILAVIDANNG